MLRLLNYQVLSLDRKWQVQRHVGGLANFMVKIQKSVKNFGTDINHIVSFHGTLIKLILHASENVCVCVSANDQLTTSNMDIQTLTHIVRVAGVIFYGHVWHTNTHTHTQT